MIIKLFVFKLHQAARQKLEAHLVFVSFRHRNLTVVCIICHFSCCIVFSNTLWASHVNILSPHKVPCVIFKVSGSTVRCCQLFYNAPTLSINKTPSFISCTKISRLTHTVLSEFSMQKNTQVDIYGLESLMLHRFLVLKALNVVLINIRDITVS